MKVTPAETLVLKKLCEGKQRKVIAYQLGLSHRTVQTHIANMMRNNGARNSIQLVLMWLGLFKREVTI